MPRPLPPLNALRAFEAAARHLSFTNAAQELHVTQAAISHQVKSLEAILGVKLFRRLTRSLLLTDDGQALLPGLRDGFDRIAQAVERVGQASGGGALTVSLMTTFALGWLVPRLPRFQAAHPEVDVRLTTTQRLIDFAREDVDVAIRYGHGNWPGLRCDKLFDDYLTPLCAPDMAKRLKAHTDLKGLPLLTTSGGPDEWGAWFTQAGLKDFPRTLGTSFDSTLIAVQASIQGVGIAIGDPYFFADDIAAGRLAQPFKLVVNFGKAYWFVSPEQTASRPKVEAFRAWCLAESAALANIRKPGGAKATPAPSRANNKSGRAAAASRRRPTAGRAPGRGDGSDD
jgi:DNA-binding transcriptional LysR family regulator